MGKLTGKKAIVTGASRGIGLAIATKLASEGADVAILSTSVKEELAAKLSAELGVQVKSYACNVADSETVQNVFKQIIADMGTVDILVNNAGITRDGLLMRMKDEEFDAVIATNLRSVFLCTRAVARTMMGKRTGRIINISSINALRGQAGQANYAAAKAGIIGMTRSNSREFASRGITVNPRHYGERHRPRLYRDGHDCRHGRCHQGKICSPDPPRTYRKARRCGQCGRFFGLRRCLLHHRPDSGG